LLVVGEIVGVGVVEFRREEEEVVVVGGGSSEVGEREEEEEERFRCCSCRFCCDRGRELSMVSRAEFLLLRCRTTTKRELMQG